MNLWEDIRSAVKNGSFLVGWHARRRLRKRKVALWQIEIGLEEGKLTKSRPRSKPNPSVVVDQILIDGTKVRVVWSWLRTSKRAKLVTIMYPRRKKP